MDAQQTDTYSVAISALAALVASVLAAQDRAEQD